MSTIYLYVKTHNITGLKYLGQTIKDPYIYKGSGLYWKRHIKIHGYDVTTEIIGIYTTPEELKKAGKYYSELWNIVEDQQWANLTDENGDGIASGKNHPMKRPEQRARMIEYNNRPEVKEKQRQRMIENNPAKDSNIIMKRANSRAKDHSFVSPQKEIIHIHNLAKFCREHNLNKGNMGQVAKGKLKQHKGWICQEATI